MRLGYYYVIYENELGKDVPEIFETIRESSVDKAIYEFCLRCKESPTSRYPTYGIPSGGDDCRCNENLNRAFLTPGNLAFCQFGVTYQGHGSNRTPVKCDPNS